MEIIIEGPDSLKQNVVVPDTARGAKPAPSITLDFRLARLRELGVLALRSESWAFASQLAEDNVLDRLEEIDGPARAVLEMRDVSYTAKSGARAGELVSYTHPVLTILGPLADGDAGRDAGGGV